MGNQLLNGPSQSVEMHASGPGYTNHSEPKNVPGIVITREGVKWRYVKVDRGSGSVAPLAGGVVYWKSLDPSTGDFTVTPDETDTIAGINGVAGVLDQAAVPDDDYWTFIKVGSVVAALVANSTVAGDKMIGYATDQNFNRIAAGSNLTDKQFGTAISAKNTTTGLANVLLQNLDW